ncbi:MAG: hypothetical protein HYV45_02665 [Candidatus Moranbacteria bacterium]|nr:hypothetical protein [Candidatus Moranbacteria bacterium]
MSAFETAPVSENGEGERKKGYENNEEVPSEVLKVAEQVGGQGEGGSVEPIVSLEEGHFLENNLLKEAQKIANNLPPASREEFLFRAERFVTKAALTTVAAGILCVAFASKDASAMNTGVLDLENPTKINQVSNGEGNIHTATIGGTTFEGGNGSSVKNNIGKIGVEIGVEIDKIKGTQPGKTTGTVVWKIGKL